jgi:hypothetical protein
MSMHPIARRELVESVAKDAASVSREALVAGVAALGELEQETEALQRRFIALTQSGLNEHDLEAMWLGRGLLGGSLNSHYFDSRLAAIARHAWERGIRARTELATPVQHEPDPPQVASGRRSTNGPQARQSDNEPENKPSTEFHTTEVDGLPVTVIKPTPERIKWSEEWSAQPSAECWYICWHDLLVTKVPASTPKVDVCDLLRALLFAGDMGRRESRQQIADEPGSTQES